MPYILRNLRAKKRAEMAIVGYARVSTQDQNLSGQIDALRAAGATTIYREKVSGARADRPPGANCLCSDSSGIKRPSPYPW
jgi:hypothetical protein